MVVTATLFDAGDNPRFPSAPISLSPGGSPLPVKGATRAVAAHVSEVDGVDLAPFYVGARLLGLRSVGPQQIELAGVLLAEDADGRPLLPEVVACQPRRASKTTTIWACLLGLCATQPGFRVVVTAQTYVKARERFMEVYRVLAPRNVGDYEMKRGAADMSIEWRNGSRLWVVTPEGQAFRGDGADRILFDEAQEHNPEKTADLLGGALALMDTRFEDDIDLTIEDARPDGQLIVTGTAGQHRAGMLWDYLERGRAGHIGIVEYAVPDSLPVAFAVDSDDGRAAVATGWGLDKTGKWVLNEPAIIGAHPGIGTLTSLGVIRARFNALGLGQFQREYAGQWPHDVTTRAISPEDWTACRVTTAPPYPASYALGFDVAPDQSSAALVAAWRDEKGRPWFEVIEHRAGDSWLPSAVHSRTRKRSNLRVGYDNIGPNQAVADRLIREARPRPRLYLLGTRETTAACAQVAQEIGRRRARFVTDPAMDAAAEVAVRRTIGDGSWAWGRLKSGDIATLVAGTSALKTYDLHTRPASAGRPRIITASKAAS